MSFPNDMTFQYFFFDTYVGYFLQALPISILVSIIYWFIKLKKDKETSISKKSTFLSFCMLHYRVNLFDSRFRFNK